MKIFLSWSGARSKAVAEAFYDWLPAIIPAVIPFYSSKMEKGLNWNNELDAELKGTDYGIVFLTPNNLNSTWIHYEVGSLAKSHGAMIWTFLHEVNPRDVPKSEQVTIGTGSSFLVYQFVTKQVEYSKATAYARNKDT
jgi:hypothetical protein